MKVALDTNVLLRIVIDDDKRQTDLAIEAIEAADHVSVSTVVLCELVWELRRNYKLARAEIAEALRRIVRDVRMELDRLAVEAGLAALDAGGDFADGVIAYEARRARVDRLLTFDRAFAKRSRTPPVALLRLPPDPP